MQRSNTMIRTTSLFAISLISTVLAEESSWLSGDDLAIDLVASHPVVEQPIFLNFDHRGRMWVAQYRQYPFPAGSKVVGKDRFWRSEYDKLPSPPGHPEYVPGKDLISIHEDTNRDGSFDKVSSFLEGLNFCTSFAHDHGGLWVLQPPYLLFYEDKDRDDKPDGPPQVHLRGFGIEDSHSLANSLTWGPDGWLYGANGSTTSLRVTVEGKKDPPVVRAGQLIWRYHPKRRVFEIFAEGGGNNLSCEFDSVGRLYSGSNTAHVAFYYHQGAYYQKTFGKHGELSNPHTYGYLPGILHQKYARVTNSITIYEGGELPARFEGAMVFANPLTLGVGSYRPKLDGLNFSVVPNGIVDVRKDDKWFCPVYVDTGPDGALYVCDWYDEQCNHLKHSEGQLHANDGRLFRIRARENKVLNKFDLSKLTLFELLEHLKGSNRWWREEARHALWRHKDREDALPTIEKWIAHEEGQLALEGLWCWSLIDGLAIPIFRKAMRSANPHVRRWAIRLAVDNGDLTPAHLAEVSKVLVAEEDLEVLAQTASSAARLPIQEAFSFLRPLLGNKSIRNNTQLSLLTWWAIEPHCENFSRECVALLLRKEVMAPKVFVRLNRWLAASGDLTNLKLSAEMLSAIGEFTKDEQRELWFHFDEAFKGRSFATIPDEMILALAGRTDLPLHLELRLFPQNRSVLNEALRQLEGLKKNRETLLRLIEYFGENPHPDATSKLLGLLDVKDARILIQIFASLQGIESPKIARAVLKRLPTLRPEEIKAAEILLLSRASWVSQWLGMATKDKVLKGLLTPALQKQIVSRAHPEHLQKLEILFPKATDPEKASEVEIQKVQAILAKSIKPNIRNGHALFKARCAACHVLHADGGDIGPSLTSYQREDLKTLLPSILEPSREIREGFENYILEVGDGRKLMGFLKTKNKRVVILQPAGGAPLTIAADQVLSLEPTRTSLMPPGLLNGLSEQELSDFFAYLRSPQPLNLQKR
ncbi:MAG: c-type cytochrome [Verrucomicrobia bacterium]|nr:c-type cytochrome [Verrucomicrobiota bacterium]